MEQTFKPGDFIRLTDPLSNGEIVRIDSVDEHEFASWLGGSQNCDMEQIEIKVEEDGNPFTDDLREYTVTLSDRVQEIESDFGVKLYPESAVEFWKRRSEIAEESIIKLKDYIKKVCKESSDDIQKLDTENKKLKEELSRCRAANADYLTAKTEAENEAKLLKQEISDLKVPESRKNRYLRDELHKVRLECQQAWKAAEKERKENAELRMEVKGYISNLNKTAEAASYFNKKYEAAKRQLDESNKQIEIYAKKVRNLEAELEEVKNQKSIQQLWKEMRMEVVLQTSGNSKAMPTFDEFDKMYSLNDIDELIENLNEKQIN